MQKLEFANCELHVHTSIKGIMESESSLLATSYDVDGASSLDESQRDEGNSSSALKIVYHYYENFLCVNKISQLLK